MLEFLNKVIKYSIVGLFIDVKRLKIFLVFYVVIFLFLELLF